MDQKAFLYSVNPRKTIIGLSGVNAVRTPKSLYLTKEDVMICLQKATVYRRFSSEGVNERVTVANIDRLHRADYISEEDWKNYDKENDTIVEQPVIKETVVDAPAVVEEVVNDVVEENIQQKDDVAVENTEEVTELITSENIEETNESDIETETEIESVVNDTVNDTVDDEAIDETNAEANEEDKSEQKVQNTNKVQQFNYSKNNHKRK